MPSDRIDFDEPFDDESAADLVEHCLELLRARFEAAHIFASHFDGETAHVHQQGVGNPHTRSGQVRDWLAAEDEKVRAHARHEFDQDRAESD